MVSTAIETAETRIARQARMLKRMQSCSRVDNSTQITRAKTLSELREAYQLVYSIYHQTGYISSDNSRMRLRIYEATPEMATFISKFDGRIVGVLGVIGDSPDLGLPSDSAFKRELNNLRNSGLRLCEVTNQAVAPEYRNSAVAPQLIRCAMAQGISAGFDQAIVSVSKKHQRFYEALGFTELGGLRSYSSAVYDPVVALTASITQYKKRTIANGDAMSQLRRRFFVEENPFLTKVSQWNEEASRHFLTCELLRALFADETNFLFRRSSSERKLLKYRWGKETFRRIAKQPRLAWALNSITTFLCWIDMWRLSRSASLVRAQSI